VSGRGWFAGRLDDIPQPPKDEPGDPDWHPLQHHFGLTAFGANVYVGREPGDELLGEHDEVGSGQEELYVVLAGRASFTLDGAEVDAPARTVVAVPAPAVRRSAVAVEPATTVLALGGERRDAFQSSWDARHFESVQRAN
jgi:hypothetical protein